MAEDMGDFARAAAHFREALSADPQFRDARERLRGAVGAGVLSRSGRWDFLQVSSRVDRELDLFTGPAANLIREALMGAVYLHQQERATKDSGSASPYSAVTPQNSAVVPSLEAIITIIITIPR